MTTLLSPQQLHPYQKEAVLHGLYHPHAMFWLQMGLGKTIIALTIAVDRMRAQQVRKVLILGPLRVIQTVWSREARKWEHTKHLRFSVLHGDRQKRRRALLTDADVYLCNYESLNWLAEELERFRGQAPLFDMVVYDEITMMKSSTSVRVAGGKRDIRDRRTGQVQTITKVGWRPWIDTFPYRLGLTGSPAPNGYQDLHGQFLALDNGERLGPYKTHYLNSYFTKGYDGWSHEVTPAGKAIIEEKIADITLKMDAKEHLSGLPDCTTSDIFVTLPEKAAQEYKRMERQMFAEMDSGKTLEVFSRAAVSTKCLQMANGAAYLPAYLESDSDEATQQQVTASQWERVHDAKLDALADILEEAAGAPVLLAYTFKSDAARIMQRFKGMHPVNLTAVPSSRTASVLDRWREGRIPLLIGHPKSMGHGIDGLQDAGSIAVWFGVTWSLELYDQFNARLNRQGQRAPVSILRILAEGTLDEAVVAALEGKATDELSLKAAIQSYRRKAAGLPPPVSFI